MLKTYNQLNDIEQLGVCTVQLRHKEKIARCRIFVVPGDSPALLGMPDIELLVGLKIMCYVVEGQQVDRKFNSQTVEPSSALSCNKNTHQDSRSDNVDVIKINSNMLDYFRLAKTEKQTKGQANQ